MEMPKPPRKNEGFVPQVPRPSLSRNFIGQSSHPHRSRLSNKFPRTTSSPSHFFVHHRIDLRTVNRHIQKIRQHGKGSRISYVSLDGYHYCIDESENVDANVSCAVARAGKVKSQTRTTPSLISHLSRVRNSVNHESATVSQVYLDWRMIFEMEIWGIQPSRGCRFSRQYPT